MSDMKRPDREWRFYVSDMLDFAHQIQSYTDGLDQSAFIADRRTYDATLRNVPESPEENRLLSPLPDRRPGRPVIVPGQQPNWWRIGRCSNRRPQ